MERQHRELARLYLTNDATEAQRLVESLLVRDIVFVEEIDGDRLVLEPGLSARVQLEILLWREEYGNRCSFKDLTRWVHSHSVNNVRVTLHTMRKKNLAHETEEGWKLTDSGMREAEAEIGKLLSSTTSVTTIGKSRAKGARRGTESQTKGDRRIG